MGTNNLSQVGTAPKLAVGTQVDQYFTALSGAFVPRNASGVATDAGASIGSSDYHWEDAWFGDGTNVAMFVDGSTQRVGIGTSSPGDELEVNGVVTAKATNSRFRLFGSTTDFLLQNVDSDGRFRIYNDTTNSEDFTLLSDGKVGFGTSNPGTILDSSVTAKFQVGDGTESTYASLKGSANGNALWYFSNDARTYNVGITGDDTFRITDDTSDEVRLYISTDGKLSVGGLSPSYLLDAAKATSGSDSTSAIRNTSNTASSGAVNLIEVAGASAGDPITQWSISGTVNYNAGIDNDDDLFKISRNSDLSNPSIIVGGNAAGTGVSPVFIGTTSAAFFGVQETFDASDLAVKIQNDGTSAASDVSLQLRTLGGTSDLFIHLANVASDFYIGSDGSDSGNFKISRNSNLSSEDMEIDDSTGAVSFPNGIDAGASGATLKSKVIEIGDWNMNVSASGTSSINVSHGLGSDFKNIRVLTTMIRNDADTQYDSFSDGVTYYIDSTEIELLTNASGLYDSVAYDSTSYNRGWITVWYEA